MSAGKRRGPDGDPWIIGTAMRWLALMAILLAFLVPTGWLPIIPASTEGTIPTAAEGHGAAIVPLGGATATPTPPLTPTPHTPRIGIIAGHLGSDSGALCPDGLEEVQVNETIARRVVALLQQRGWEAELLQEFDPRLERYRADVLLSIHADSCTFPGKSGFKVARAESSYIPVEEDRLVQCIVSRYGARTGLPFDANTITYDMTRYHAYNEIDPNTPAAIIETGFLLDDRDLLVNHPEIVAQGIVDGIVCFVEHQAP